MTEQEKEKTHYRKAFNSPYLSAQDITEPTELTIGSVALVRDKTNKTKDDFNTATFVEKEIRKGEVLKPMILNAINSHTMRDITNSHFIEDWQNVRVTVFVDENVRFGNQTVEGLRIVEAKQKPYLTAKDSKKWDRALAAAKRDGNLDGVLKHMEISPEDQKLLLDGVDSKGKGGNKKPEVDKEGGEKDAFPG